MFPVAAELAPVMATTIIVIEEMEGEKWSPKSKTGVSIAVIIVVATGTTMPVRA
jgi:preprotein translocase subunit Sec61beta